jgi:regulator of sigma E protease
VSAGVIMNILLAAIGFMVVFLIGFDAPPAIVGNVVPNSPAAQAGVQVGDEIVMLDGKRQYDFTKISLNTALLEENHPAPLLVRHVDGTESTMQITPQRPDADPRGFLMLGVGQPFELRGIKHADATPEMQNPKLVNDQLMLIKSEDAITAVNGEPVKIEEYTSSTARSRPASR